MTSFGLASNQIMPSDVARYMLFRAHEDGELVSPLKMQKIVYYAYVWTLVKNKKKLFEEPIEAWPNGPVIPSLYQNLKKYGSSPIGDEFIGINSQDDLDLLVSKFPREVKTTLDEVYEEYSPKSAFELVVSTHGEKPWIEAREGLESTEKSNNPISDNTILEQYASA